MEFLNSAFGGWLFVVVLATKINCFLDKIACNSCLV